MTENNVIIIGLGKIGHSLFKNMKDHNIPVKGYDLQLPTNFELEDYISEDEYLNTLKSKIYILCLPSGNITEQVFQKLIKHIPEDSIILDFANTHFPDSVRRSSEAQNRGIRFLDVGISGGPVGARNGACLMVGGSEENFRLVKPLLDKVVTPGGLLHTGPSGTGHYTKMIHNGIEYGIMQSISEGFNIFANSDFHDFDLAALAGLFNNGSVIRSWLMELTEQAFIENPKMENIQGIVPSSGEGKWTVEEALRLQLNAPVITQSLFVRYASTDNQKIGEKVTSSLRNQFGGHDVIESL